MDEKYDFKSIESRWQDVWEKEKYGISKDFSHKPKHYNLVEFPYPSGAGLHVGHCMGYGASDAYCRMKRMQGFEVMFPIGWDAFGLPTENYAIKTGIQPAKATEENIKVFKRQMKMLGLSFDWSRELDTTDPDYFRWTQWIFLQFYKHAIINDKLVEVTEDDTETPRLAFQQEMPVNWCPSCKINLANEEVISSKCERCGSETEKRMQKQWMLRITAYADRLISDLDTVDYLDQIKTQQINWIGRSEGSEIDFKIKDSDLKIKVFTTRADTLYGCTYIVIAPESEYVSKLKDKISNLDEVEEYIRDSKKKTEIERTELAKDKTGVELKGIKAINPINNKEIPVFVADYVLAGYGTGAVMAVPAHDERDWDFAKKYNIPIESVIMPKLIDQHDPPIDGVETIERKQVCAIVVDPKNNKILAQKFKKFPWLGFVTGGIDNNESAIETAKREILEETGYKNVKLIRNLGGPIEVHFHAAHKGVNRKATYYNFLFELIDHEQSPISKDEAAESDAFWTTWDELYQMSDENNILSVEHDILYNRFNNLEKSFCDYGVLYNSFEFDGLTSEEGKNKITEKLKEMGSGDFTVNYKIRDWIFSRQHYWGEPIPIIHCDKCGTLPVPESYLPVKLPELENYQPTDTGESPLAKVTEWVNVKCPKCGGNAKRETDTMPNWAGSSWYYSAYAMRKLQNPNVKFQINENIFETSRKELDYWLPVDLYNGGMEHTTLHLLYSRFWHKFLYDLKLFSSSEPYQKRIAHGIILGSDNRKMSKSFGNVINPDDIVKEYGADCTRSYIMFIGPYDKESAWSTAGLQGVFRFLKRVYANRKLVDDAEDSKELLIKLNQTIAGVTEDIENFRFNTVISKLMEFNNTLEKTGHISKESYKKFLPLLFCPAPHIASELFNTLGGNGYLWDSKWPIADKKYLVADKIEVVVQVNGKVRDKLMVDADIDDDSLRSAALESDKVASFIGNNEIKKVIVVPKKLVSIVI